MTSEEFKAMTGDELTEDVHALYTALLNMSKQDFCRLHTFGKVLLSVTGTDIFGELKETVEAYEKLREHAEAIGLGDAVTPIHLTERAIKAEENLLKICSAMKAAAPAEDEAPKSKKGGKR